MKVTVANCLIEVPGEWHEAKKDTAGWQQAGTVGYWMQQTESARLQLIVSEVPVQHTDKMPPLDKQAVIKQIHESMDESMGLIEVAVIDVNGGKQAIKTILKQKVDNAPMYTGKLQYKTGSGGGMVIQVVAREYGVTGVREAIVGDMLSDHTVTETKTESGGTLTMQGGLPKDFDEDPYDPGYKKGYLMNKSELSEYDAKFPDHCLSVLRSTLDSIQSSLQEVS